MDILNWGVLSTAAIGTDTVIPAIHKSENGRVVAIASRDAERAASTAAALGIERSYGSYEALLDDPAVDVIYNPLPNHLHVSWTIRAAEAGKHVLCEKPIAMSAPEVEALLEVRDRTGVHIQEAFMVRTHPQWLRTAELVAEGEIGELRAIQGFFSYHNTDVGDIRNQADIGGGGMLDIGCYPVTTARFVIGIEPQRVFALVDNDPDTRIDRLGTAILDFSGIHASFTYGTQLFAHQRMMFVGTYGRIVVEIPFNPAPEGPCRLSLTKDDAPGAPSETIEVPACDQYTVAADAFADSIRQGSPHQPVPLEDSMSNMRVLDALMRSATTGDWQIP